MGDLEVFIPCDRCGPYTRSVEIWTKGMELLLSFCSHHADKNAVALQAQGFHPLESEALTR